MSQPLYYDFGAFRADVRRRMLFRDGEPVSLTPKAFSLLLVFLERRGENLTKAELIESLWPDGAGSEANLGVNVATLRKALGEGARDNRYVVTIPTVGYRFVGKVEPVREDIPPARPRPRHGDWPTRIRRLAVLPFRVLPPHRDEEYLALGLTDALITQLSRLRELSVPSAGTVSKYTGFHPDPRHVARELHVDGVLSGTVTVESRTLILDLQLADGEAGTVLWAESFTSPRDDLHRTRRTAAEALRRVLRVPAGVEEQESFHREETHDNAAFQLFLQGRHFSTRFDPASLRRSLEFYERAVGRDPRYAPAHAGLAEAWFTLWHYGALPTEVAIPRARDAVERALELDPDLPLALIVRAHLALFHDWDWDEAERLYLQVIALEPNNALGHHHFTYHLITSGQFDRALARCRHAQHLDPTSLLIHTRIGAVHYYARRYQDAVEQYRTTLEMDPGHFWARFLNGMAHLQLGRYEQALAQFQVLRDGHGDLALICGAESFAMARMGDREAALCCRRKLEAMTREQFVHPYNFAIVELGLDRPDEAVRWLEEAHAQRFGYLAFLRVEPFWDPLRSHPRFAALVPGGGPATTSQSA